MKQQMQQQQVDQIAKLYQLINGDQKASANAPIYNQEFQPELTAGEALGRDIFGTTKRMSEVPSAEMNQTPIAKPQQGVGGTNLPNQKQAPIDFSVLKYAPNAHEAARLGEALLKKQSSAKKEALVEKDLERKQSKDVRKYLEPYQEIRSAAKKDLKDTDLLIKLAGKGDLRAGNAHGIMEKLGIEGFNRNLDTELAGKAISRLSQNIATAYGKKGVRLTNFLEQNFQKSLPSLWNTPSGIIAIAGTIESNANAILAKDKIRANIIKENGGDIPWNIEELVDEKAAPIEDYYENQALTYMKTAQLPLAGTVPPNTTYKDNETGEIFGVKNGKWVVVA